MTRCILYRVLWALRLYLSTIYVELEQVIWRDLDVKHPVSPQIETYTILPFLLEKHNRTKVFLKPQLDYTKNTYFTRYLFPKFCWNKDWFYIINAFTDKFMNQSLVYIICCENGKILEFECGFIKIVVQLWKVKL